MKMSLSQSPGPYLTVRNAEGESEVVEGEDGQGTGQEEIRADNVHKLYLQEIKTEDLDRLLKLQEKQRVDKKRI